MKPKRVILNTGVADVLANAAVRGYEAPYKQERLGILLGRFHRDVGIVDRAVLYRGGDRTRTEASVDPDYFSRRVRQLMRDYNSQFIGTFHSHVEIAATITSALSMADRTHLCEDPPHVIELIVAIWGSNQPSRPTQRYVQGEYRGYRFRIAGYQMFSPYQLIPVLVRRTVIA